MVSDNYQTSIDIISEETPSYFAGQKTVDEVCKIIQSRAQTFVGEQS